MNDVSISQFHLSLLLPFTAESAKIAPSTYWGITVADPNAKPNPFDNQEAFLVLVEGSFAKAAEKADAENDRLGIPTPIRGDNDTVVHRLRGEIVIQNDR